MIAAPSFFSYPQIFFWQDERTYDIDRGGTVGRTLPIEKIV